jgi:hypothetical protein
LLPVGVVEARLQQRRTESVVECLPGDVRVGELAAPAVAARADLDLAVGFARL